MEKSTGTEESNRSVVGKSTIIIDGTRSKEKPRSVHSQIYDAPKDLDEDEGRAVKGTKESGIPFVIVDQPNSFSFSSGKKPSINVNQRKKLGDNNQVKHVRIDDQFITRNGKHGKDEQRKYFNAGE